MYLKPSVFIILTLLLYACAATDKRTAYQYDYNAEDETGNYRYDAWRLVDSSELQAVNTLLDESDMLMNNHAYDAASDKLERVLRIKPDYAPAWSRLAWLALQMNSATRSVQMAKRSNSFAYADPQLQSLNWSFIRTASQMLNDEKTYDMAVKKIESLKAF